MPVVNGTIQFDGALVDVEIGWGASAIRSARQKKKPIPPACQVQAIIDTGAEITCVNSSVIQQLSIPAGAAIPVNVPATSGYSATIQYEASLWIIHPSGDHSQDLFLPDLIILELNLGPLGYQALIGRDVLSLCDFLYQGPAGQFQLTY